MAKTEVKIYRSFNSKEFRVVAVDLRVPPGVIMYNNEAYMWSNTDQKYILTTHVVAELASVY